MQKICAELLAENKKQTEELMAEAMVKAQQIQDKHNTFLAKIKIEEAEIKQKALDEAAAIIADAKAKKMANQDPEVSEDSEEENENPKPASPLTKYEITIIKASDYPNLEKAIANTTELCKHNEFGIPKNVKKVQENLNDELVNKNNNYQTLLAIQGKDTIVGVMTGEVQVEHFFINNLAMKKGLPPKENVELRLILQAIEVAKLAGRNKLLYHFTVNEGDLEKKYQQKSKLF